MENKMFKDKKILIVDDSPVERHILKEIIKGLHFNVFEADSGATGVDKALNIKPDIILMDVNMPDFNGFQATRKIVTELPDVPVIMCTSKGQTQDKIWGQRQGASAYLVKPVDGDELIAEIKKLLS